MTDPRPVLDILLYGAAGFAVQVLECLTGRGEQGPRIAGLIDATKPGRRGQVISKHRVLGGEEVLEQYRPETTGIIVAFGAHRPRIDLLRRLRDGGWRFPNIIHPSAIVSPSARTSEGIIVAAGAVVGPCCDIGFGAIINECAVVSHETHVGACAQICPNAAVGGRCRLDSGAFIGIGASILPDIQIGANACVGAGAVVCRDVPEGVVVMGVPAREHGTAGKEQQDAW